ncbi:MAG: hypothetical protein JST54_15280 [Deltaproteobacteria bacterium]|nr:hypothetical protein [Deltaproteobacteria bacterium]
MMTVEMKVGRFIEIRGRGVVTQEEMQAFRSRLFALMVKAGRPIVAAVDMRGLAPFDDTVRGMFVGLMRGDNPHVERSAHLAEAGSAYHQQAVEMITLAGNPSRKLFSEVPELEHWLGERMDDAERAQMKAFLAEPG